LKTSINKNNSNLDNLDCRLKQLALHCEQFKGAITRKSLFQLISTLVLFISSLGISFVTFNSQYWLTAILIIPTGGLLVRLFIFQHDCGHQSFFKKRKWNDRVGRLLSVLTWTPYDYWRRTHNTHHATSGHLSKRGTGDINTLTVREYRERTWLSRFFYRVYRHPIVLFFFGGPAMILFLQRFPVGQPLPFNKIWRSIIGLNMALLLVYGSMVYLLGLKFFLLVFIPIFCVAAWIGGWLFYIQHQFENTYWDHENEWDFMEAAILGSSYFALPKILNWFSGNIGYHHLHHICGAIPNYRLQECHETAPNIPETIEINLLQSLKCLDLTLWDEDLRKLVSFNQLKEM
jgi:acyl-lipid omega-6 desaturase (Delta-12 desaturase)